MLGFARHVVATRIIMDDVINVRTVTFTLNYFAGVTLYRKNLSAKRHCYRLSQQHLTVQPKGKRVEHGPVGSSHIL